MSQEQLQAVEAVIATHNGSQNCDDVTYRETMTMAINFLQESFPEIASYVREKYKQSHGAY
jgi:hypothetical protein